MTVEDHLTGIGHDVWVETVQDGNVITGTFQIEIPHKGSTRNISVTATEEEMEEILEVNASS